jgi:hypothetical protein
MMVRWDSQGNLIIKGRHGMLTIDCKLASEGLGQSLTLTDGDRQIGEITLSVSQQEAPQEKRGLVSKATSLAQAVITGKYVSKEVREERQAICHTCRYRSLKDGVACCSVCGCKVSSDARTLVNLTAYEENLPKWGCKHPNRKNGEGWKR